MIDDLKSWISTYIRQEGRKKGYLFRSNLGKQISNRSIRDIVKIVGKGALDMVIHPTPSAIPLPSTSSTVRTTSQN